MLGQLLGVENSAYGWTEIMAGIRIRQLKDTEPSDTPPFQVPAGWIQILFCREGGLQADLRSGRQVRCAERCVLVLAGPAQIQCLRVLRERLNGVLVEVDAVLARDGLEKLGQLLGLLSPEDLLLITADHGNDPTAPGTDHTREMVPLLAWSPAFTNAGPLPQGDSFAAVGATIADNFQVELPEIGTSYLSQLI